MFKMIQRSMVATTLLIGLSGCYPQSLVTAETKVSVPVAEKYLMIWDRLPKSSRENLLGTLIHVNQRQDGSYSLEYKHRRKRERKTFETLKLADSFYIQLRDGDAFELMRVEFLGDEVELFSELPGCSIKNGDGKNSEINMIRLDTRNCVPALGISPTEMKVTDGVGKILLQGGTAEAIEFLERYGSKMYAEKKYRLKVQ
ncbi:MAG: hypothetical protein ABFS08_08835 [Pseudomonadota bacterium]